MDAQTQNIKARVRRFMEKYHMADGGDGVLAAVSGGADSVCLLFLLSELAGEWGFRLAVFHMNHGIRGAEAERDESFVRELCGRLGLGLRVIRADVPTYAAARGLSAEEAGRLLRYQYMEEERERLGFQRIATAHHRDDDVETVLLNLFRGSGLRGLGGIRPVRGQIIRPLLCLDRAEIEAYLVSGGISWCEDSTNQDNQYTRNKIRNELLPWIRENLNSQADGHILGAARLAGQADAYVAEQAEKLLHGAGTAAPGMAAISTEVFDAQPELLKTYLLRSMLAEAAGTRKDISERHIRAILALTGPGGGTEAALPYGLRAVRGYGELRIEKNGGERTLSAAEPVFSTFPAKKDMKIPKNQYTKWFDYDKIKGTLSVRTRKEGDFFMISGGKRKLLRRYMIDEKIPERDRDQISLLADGSHILWVIGYRTSEFYRVTENTKTILEVKVCKGEDHG